MWHLTCPIASGLKTCPCQQAGCWCTTCRCIQQCQKKSDLDSVGRHAERGTTIFFHCSEWQVLVLSSPRLIAEAQANTGERDATEAASLPQEDGWGEDTSDT
eukprot:1138093-Ditylum_brightwellii.AAC.1